ncbi:hypothetical protein GF378_03020 [Candidatus Pacearchaeota archaeon]|nr:hypothetical protein [Candidatus Pacearchaeota archaeon]
MAIFEDLGGVFLESYQALLSVMPPFMQTFLKFFLIALLIVVYAIFIWKFYKSVSKKNLIGLNLSQYNKSKHALITKLTAGVLYLLEYILILPILIFIWFSFFTVFLILLTENVNTGTILILSATTIAAIRMIAYHSEELSRDVAKLVPLTLLATSLLTPGFFSVERIIGHFKEIPIIFSDILTYLFLIIFLEIVLRFFDFMLSLFYGKDIISSEDEEDKENNSDSDEQEEVKKELAKPAKVKKKK